MGTESPSSNPTMYVNRCLISSSFIRATVMLTTRRRGTSVRPLIVQQISDMLVREHCHVIHFSTSEATALKLINTCCKVLTIISMHTVEIVMGKGRRPHA